MRNIQKIMPMIQQQLRGSIIKDGKVESISVDVGAMTAEIKSAAKEMATLLPNLTFSDFHQLVNLGTTSSGKLVLPNYNKETASDNLNRFIELFNQPSKYIEAGVSFGSTAHGVQPNEVRVSFPSISVPHPFQMKGVDTITGKRNGFLNVAPELGNASSSFAGSNFSQSPSLTFTRPTFNWGNSSSGTLLTTVNSINTVNGHTGVQMLNSNQTNLADFSNPSSHTFILLDQANTSAGTSAFEYMTNTSFATFETFQNKSLLSFPNLSLSNDLGGLCAIGTTCRQKLSIGDLSGAMNEMMNNLPEGVIIK